MVQELQGVPLPPPRKRYIRLLRAKVGTDVRLVSWLPTVVGHWTHYDGWQSLPCLKGHGHCPGCQLKWLTLWKGFLAGWSQEHTCRALLELPEQTVRLNASLSDGTVDLRGALVAVHRQGPKPASRCTARVQLAFRPATDCGEPPDILDWYCEAVGIVREGQGRAVLPAQPDSEGMVPL